MRRNSLLLGMVPWIVLAELPGADVVAQQQLKEDTPHWQAECRAALSVVENRPSRTAVITSLQTLVNCERSAGAGISSVWRTHPSETDVIGILRFVSRGMRDGRIMAAAIATAEDRSASGDLRIAALGVLGAYVDPAIFRIREQPDLEYLVQRYSITVTPHTSQRNGVIPLDPGYEAMILNVLGRIASTGVADERISGAAAVLKQWLEFRLHDRGLMHAGHLAKAGPAFVIVYNSLCRGCGLSDSNLRCSRLSPVEMVHHDALDAEVVDGHAEDRLP